LPLTSDTAPEKTQGWCLCKDSSRPGLRIMVPIVSMCEFLFIEAHNSIEGLE